MDNISFRTLSYTLDKQTLHTPAQPTISTSYAKHKPNTDKTETHVPFPEQVFYKSHDLKYN